MGAKQSLLVDIGAQVSTIEADQNLGLTDLPRITSQQRVYVAARVGGLHKTGASKEAGCSLATANKWEADPVIQQYIAHYEDEMAMCSLPRVKFGIEDAHAMYMKAYHVSATAAEMVRATDSLVKLHKIGEPTAADVPKTVSARQLADLPVAELMRLAGVKLDSLVPEPIEGQFDEVEGEMSGE